MATGGRQASEPPKVTVTASVERTDSDVRFTSFHGRVRDAVLELVAMADFEISRKTSVPLDRPHEPPESPTDSQQSPPAEPWLWTQVKPPSVEMTPTFRAVSGGPDPHFNARAELADDLKLLIRAVFRLEGGYGFLASYLMGYPPIVSPPGVINCFHLRTLPLPEQSMMQERVAEIFQEELQLVGREEIGPLRPRIELSGPLTVAMRKELPDGLGRLSHDFLEGRLSLELDIRRLHDADTRVAVMARQFVSEIESCVPSVRGRRASIDPMVIKIRFTWLLAACHALLKDNAADRWPPVRSDSTAGLFLRRFVHGTDEELSRLIPLIRTGRRRPQAGPLALRMMSKLYGISERQIKNIALK